MTPAHRDAFVAGLGFGLDDFQARAIDAIDAGRNVLVSAPTGSGKTLIANYGISRALQENVRAFYTTPLKALSNQKFAELGHLFGVENVGLLTGDTSIRRDAPIVVMTTEVLRNMLLSDAGRVRDLGLVVMDEVHYLQDPFRGGVWEEVIILTPSEVRFIALSATIANAPFVGEWLGEVRGPTSVIVESTRPISLHNHVAYTRRGQRSPELLDLTDDGRLSDGARKLDATMKNARKFRPGPQWRGNRSSAPPPPILAPRRSDLLRVLDDADMSPSIFFIFSRSACDQAVDHCRRDGLRFTSSDDVRQIERIAYGRVAEFSDDDLRALEFPYFLECLRLGLAAHHAGMVPAFREIVERCFEAGLLGVVFATETLALGVNMPARTVVLERFTKFSDSGRNLLTSGEYAQMTGRAGRRGLDDEGHAVVCFAPEVSLADIGRIALSPPPDLHSSFRPTYNFTANLIHHVDYETAVTLLERSFAQFEANRRPGGARRPLVDLLQSRQSVLHDLGYADEWRLTEKGLALRRVYHENDLLLTEAWSDGAFDDIEEGALAALLSCFAYEGRRTKPKPVTKGTQQKRPKVIKDRLGPGRRADIAERYNFVRSVQARVIEVESAYRVKHAKDLDDGFARAMAAWARGANLSTTLEAADVETGYTAPGDFVRHAKQVADLCEQLSHLDVGSLRDVAANTKLAIVRNVVAGAMAIPTSDDPET